jgi:DNA-binding transcriptional ArsR family regulator
VNCELRPRKIKLETILDDGSKITIVINGDADRNKLNRFFELIDLMDSGFKLSPKVTNANTLYEKIRSLIEENLSNGYFTLNQLAELYNSYFPEKIKKSTLSTYLSRLTDEGVLIREGYRGQYRYRYLGDLIKIDRPLSSTRF